MTVSLTNNDACSTPCVSEGRWDDRTFSHSRRANFRTKTNVPDSPKSCSTYVLLPTSQGDTYSSGRTVNRHMKCVATGTILKSLYFYLFLQHLMIRVLILYLP